MLTMMYMKTIAISASDKIRFEHSYKASASGCWEWEGTKFTTGYGLFRAHLESYQAHRVSYFIHTGSIPLGMEIHHHCKNRGCVNPFHLQPVYRAQHPDVGGSINRSKRFCPAGHEYMESNTYRGKNGHRNCRECNKVSARKYRLRLKEREAN